MTHFDLGSPNPREVDLPAVVPTYAIETCKYLSVPEPQRSVNFWDVLNARKSRAVHGPIDESTLSFLLWSVAKTKLSRRESGGSWWQHRNVPSAGGRHPIDIAVIERNNGLRMAIYDSMAHALCYFRHNEEEALQRIVNTVNVCAPNVNGTILWFIANFDKTMSKYEHGESLVWRDAGALLATCYLVCEAAGLGCCGVGITGEPWVSTYLGEHKNIRGVGGCVVGVIRDDDRRDL